MPESVERLVWVCAGCRRASCWQGASYCDRYASAGLTRLPVSKLEEEARESPLFWRAEP